MPVKKLLALLFLTTFSYGADRITTRLGLTDPQAQSVGWDTKMSANFDILDSSLAILSSTQSQTFTGPVTFSSNVVISSLSFNTLRVATATYPGSEALVVNGTSKFFGTSGGVLSLCDRNGLNCMNMSLDNSNPATGVNIGTATIGYVGATTVTISGLTAGRCVETTTGGQLIAAGAACGTGSGSGGSSALQVTLSGVQITSPTASVSFSSTGFIASSVGSSTSSIGLNPATTMFIHSQSTLQSNATFYVSSGTALNITATTMSITRPSSSEPGQIALREGLRQYVDGTGQGAFVVWADSVSHWGMFSPSGVSSYTFVGSSAPTTRFHLPMWGGQSDLLDSGVSVDDIGYDIEPASVTIGAPVGLSASTLTVTSTASFPYVTSSEFANVSSFTLTGAYFDVSTSSSAMGPTSLNGSYGTAGQVFTSQGPGSTPTWSNSSGGGNVNSALQGYIPYYSVSGSSNVLSGSPGITVTTITVSTLTVTSSFTLSNISTMVFTAAVELQGNVYISSNVTITSISTASASGVFFDYTTSSMTVSSATVTGYFKPPSMTLAQIAVTTPTATGQLFYCSNCTTDVYCASTGTVNAASFARTTARTTACQ